MQNPALSQTTIHPDTHSQHHPVPPPSNPTPLKPKNNLKILYILSSVIVLLIIGFGSVFALDQLNTPSKIKQRVSITQPVFEDYMLTIDQISDHLTKDDDNSDSDSMEREAEKAKSLYEQAEKTHQTLIGFLPQLDIKEITAYKTNLNQYLEKTNKLIELEKASGNTYKSYSSIMRDYEDVITTIGNANSYIVNNPDKYVEEMNKAIQQEKDLIEKMKNMESIEETKELIEYSPKIFETEVDFIEKMVDGVKTRDYNAITQAQSEFTKNQTKVSKDVKRLEDELDELTENLIREISAIEEQIKNEYNRLSIQYKF